MFCKNCGAQIPDDSNNCSSCGAAVEAAAGQSAADASFGGAGNSVINEFDPADIEKNKTMAGLAYLLFFLPLIACPESKFGRFHANQGLVLLIVGIGGSIVLTIIPIIGWILLPIFGIAVTVFGILGLINGFKGVVKELPLIGKFKIIK